jgi:hypothetical protein
LEHEVFDHQPFDVLFDRGCVIHCKIGSGRFKAVLRGQPSAFPPATRAFFRLCPCSSILGTE